MKTKCKKCGKFSRCTCPKSYEEASVATVIHDRKQTKNEQPVCQCGLDPARYCSYHDVTRGAAHSESKAQTEDDTNPTAWLGHYNDQPPNWREITEKELAQDTRFGSYSPDYTEFRQIMIPGKPTLSVKLYVFWDGTGVGLAINYLGEGYYDKPRPPEPLKHVRWFSFAKCLHEYEERNIGRCLHRYTCKKCGFAHTVDSSD